MKNLFEFLLGFSLHWYLLFRNFTKLTEQEERAKKNIKDAILPKRNVVPVKTIICLIGPTGSGKTSVANLLSEKICGLVISGDVIRTELRKQGAGYAKTHVITEWLVNYFNGSNHHIILDSDFSEMVKRASIRNLAFRLGARLVFIQINCDYDVLAGRVLADEYSETKNPFFYGASCNWDGDNHGAVVKLRELWRNTPKHYVWKKGIISGGEWLSKKFACADQVIDTTHSLDESVTEIAEDLLAEY